MSVGLLCKVFSSLSFIFIFFLSSASSIFAQGSKIGEECVKGVCYSNFDQLVAIFNNVVSIVAVVGGFLAFIALIIGGIRYITARGDPKAITAAQGIITWAVVGLALIIISWLILQLIAQFTGLPLTTFCIPTPGKPCL